MTVSVKRAPRTDLGRFEALAAPAVLPAWPLLAWLYGFPVFWATGLNLFAPVLLGGIMAAFLVLRGGNRATPGVLIWFAFIAWVVVCAVSLTSLMQGFGYLQRISDFVALGIAFTYYANARETITPRAIIGGFVVIWVSMIVLGTLGTLIPDARIPTLVAQVVPGSLLQNDLVRELVEPRLAEVQTPYGADEPFVRPSAPFPYTNSWGMAYALLTPLVVMCWFRLKRPVLKVLLGIAILTSFYPAVQTSNRGMILALAIFAAYVGLRNLIAGRLRTSMLVFATFGAGVASLGALGVFAAIASRQEVSDTTAGRGSIYAATLEKLLDSPIVGWATPSIDVTIGIALGTQGYAWTLMYSYGFVGLLIFYVFLARVFLVSWKLKSSLSYVLQGVIVTVAATMWFYGLGIVQSLILILVAAMLSRARADGEISVDGA